LTDGSEYSTTLQYEDEFLETPIDFVETFPAHYDGSPNITITADGKQAFPGFAGTTKHANTEYSSSDDSFRPGSEIALSQNKNNLAVAEIFQEVESPNLQLHQNSRIEEDEEFFPENAASQKGLLTDFPDPDPDFTPNFDREAGHENFLNFGQKLPEHKTDLGSTSLVLSELDATAFDRKDELDDDEIELVSTDKKKSGKFKHSKNSISDIKQDFESSFNPGFTNFGPFKGNPKENWMWGSKT